jgi:hypothetical protein
MIELRGQTVRTGVRTVRTDTPLYRGVRVSGVAAGKTEIRATRVLSGPTKRDRARQCALATTCVPGRIPIANSSPATSAAAKLR